MKKNTHQWTRFSVKCEKPPKIWFFTTFSRFPKPPEFLSKIRQRQFSYFLTLWLHAKNQKILRTGSTITFRMDRHYFLRIQLHHGELSKSKIWNLKGAWQQILKFGIFLLKCLIKGQTESGMLLDSGIHTVAKADRWK